MLLGQGRWLAGGFGVPLRAHQRHSPVARDAMLGRLFFDMLCLGRQPLVNNGLFDLDTWCLDRWFLASIFHNLRRLSCEALPLLCFGLLILPQLWCRRKRNLSRLCRCLRQRNLSLLCRCLLLRKLLCRCLLLQETPKRDPALQLLLRNGKGLCKLG